MRDLTERDESDFTLNKERFAYHKPFGNQAMRYEALRAKAKEYADMIVWNVPPSADRTAALRELWNVSMMVNGAIACNEKEEGK